MTTKGKDATEIIFKDLREAVNKLNEWAKKEGVNLAGCEEGKGIKLIGADKESILKNFVAAVDGIPDKDGKFPGPKVSLDMYNKIVDIQEAAAKAKDKKDEKEDKAAAKEKKAAEKKDKPKKEKKDAEPKEPRVTKKSIIIEMVSTKKGATTEQMATACTEAGLGDQETNIKTVGLWLRKIGFKVKKDDKGVWTKAE